MYKCVRLTLSDGARWAILASGKRKCNIVLESSPTSPNIQTSCFHCCTNCHFLLIRLFRQIFCNICIYRILYITSISLIFFTIEIDSQQINGPVTKPSILKNTKHPNLWLSEAWLTRGHVVLLFFSIIYKFFLANFHFQLHANIWAVSFSKFWNCAAYQVSPILGQISRLDKIGLSAHITCTVSRRKMQKAPPENPNPKRFIKNCIFSIFWFWFL